MSRRIIYNDGGAQETNPKLISKLSNMIFYFEFWNECAKEMVELLNSYIAVFLLVTRLQRVVEVTFCLLVIFG